LSATFSTKDDQTVLPFDQTSIPTTFTVREEGGKRERERERERKGGGRAEVGLASFVRQE